MRSTLTTNMKDRVAVMVDRAALLESSLYIYAQGTCTCLTVTKVPGSWCTSHSHLQVDQEVHHICYYRLSER